MSGQSFKLEPGRTISHFRLEKLLGEGGMGAVYLAEDLTLSRRVAIKFMRRQMLASLPNPEYRMKVEQRFIREAKSAASINHPNIAQIYEANFETDYWYIAMEFIDGSALDEKLTEDGPLKAEKALDVLEQTVHGLEFAWDSYKIIHRDIKPQNLMVNKRNFIKIVDLGLAKPVLDSKEKEEELELTGAGVPIGTPYYMAPEQAAGGDVNQQVDIFALGATVYELLTGKKCFTGKTPPMIYNKQINKDYLPLTDFGVPEDISNLIDKMLEPNISDRYSNYDVLLSDINKIRNQGVQDNSITMMQTVDAGTVEPSGKAGSMYGTVITGDMADIDQTIVDPFLPIDFKILDRYRIIKIIGRGNSGVVYHCMDIQLERECSVKSVRSGREYSQAEFPRIRKNYKKLSAKKHDNLVEVHDIQESADGEEIFIVMELLKGRNLLQFTNSITHLNETVDLEPLRPVLQKIATALDSVNQEYSIIHNDLKPVSIFITDQEEIKLLDYGVTYMPRENDPHSNDDQLWKHPISNPDYMSPELWKHQKPNTAADQYSLAVIIYEILSHKLPFWMKEMRSSIDPNEDTMTGLLEKQYKRVTETPPPKIEHLSAVQNHALMKALSKSPSERFNSCKSFIDTLFGIGSSSAKSSKIIPLTAAIVLIGLGIVGALVFMNKGQSNDAMQIADKVSNVYSLLNDYTDEDLTDIENSIAKAESLAKGKNYKEAVEVYKAIHTRLNNLYTDRKKAARAKVANREKDLLNIKKQMSNYVLKDESLKEIRDILTVPEHSKNAELKELLGIIDTLEKKTQMASEKLSLTKAALSKNKSALSKKLKDLEDQWKVMIGDENDTRDNKEKFDASISKASSFIENESYKMAAGELSNASLILNATASALSSKYTDELKQAKNTLTDLKNKTEPLLFFHEGANADYLKITGVESKWREAESKKKYRIAVSVLQKEIENINAFKKHLETKAKPAYLRNLQTLKKECAEIKSSIEPLKDLISNYSQTEKNFSEADKLLNEKNYKSANVAFISLKNNLEKMKVTLDDRLKSQVNTLNEEIVKITDRLSKHKEINSEINYAITEFEVNYSLARTKKAEREYRAAYNEFKKLVETGNKLEQTIKDLSTVRIGNDWSVPKLNLKFVWIDQMKMWVGKYEVTNGQYRKFKPEFKNVDFGKGHTINGDNQPVAMISFKSALEYCAWLNRQAMLQKSLPQNYVYRLPTRKEWVMFATAGSPENKYPWGNAFPPPNGVTPNYGEKGVKPEEEPDWNGYEDGDKLTSTVERTWANKWKIHGTAGNVWEWSVDAQGSKRAIFGGSWSSFGKIELLTQPPNNFVPEKSTFDNIGFRIVLAPLIK